MKKGIRLLGILLIAAFAFTACTKQSNSVDPGIFAGTWNGTVTCVGIPPQAASFTINMDGSTATVAGETGQGACYKTVTYTGTLVNDHLDFSTQLNIDACGNSNSFSASVYVYENSISLTESLSGPQLTTTCNFKGSK